MTDKQKQDASQDETSQKTQDVEANTTQELSLEEQLADVTDKLQRAQAELINYRKRMDQQQIETVNSANERAVKKFLPVLDNFEMALKHTQNAEEFVVGVQMIAKQFKDVLANEGVSSPDLVGKQFDSTIAEAIQVVPDETKENNSIVQEITKAYVMKNKVIRHAKVIVVRNEEKTSEE